MATPEKIAATTVDVAVPRVAIASAPIQNAADGRSAIGVSDMKTITGLHATSAAPARAVPVSNSRRPSWKVKNTSIAAETGITRNGPHTPATRASAISSGRPGAYVGTIAPPAPMR